MPDALVINLGDAMHYLSGGYLKPTIHRVVGPADEDQRKYRRLGVFYFNQFNSSVKLEPLKDSPVAQATGQTFFDDLVKEGKPIPTAEQWERSRVSAYGQGGKKKELENGHEEEVLPIGAKIVHYN